MAWNNEITILEKYTPTSPFFVSQYEKSCHLGEQGSGRKSARLLSTPDTLKEHCFSPAFQEEPKYEEPQMKR